MRLRTAATLLSIIGVSCVLQARAHDRHFDDDDDRRKASEVNKIISKDCTFFDYLANG